MRRGTSVGVALVSAMLIAADSRGQTQPATVGFDRDEVGKAPAGWTATQTGSGAANWAVVADPSAPSQPNVLKQSGQAAYPV